MSRTRALAALVVAVILAGCESGGPGQPEPAPASPGGGGTMTGTPAGCPPLDGLTERTETIRYRDVLRLPSAARIRFADLTGTARLEVVRADPACRESSSVDLAAGGTATALGLRITVVAITPSKGGVPPTVQIRVGPT